MCVLIYARVTHPDDLPQQPQHEVRLALVDVLGPDVDDVAADGLRRVERERQVLVDPVDGQVRLVDGALVDGARLRLVDQFAALDRQMRMNKGTTGAE